MVVGVVGVWVVWVVVVCVGVGWCVCVGGWGGGARQVMHSALSILCPKHASSDHVSASHACTHLLHSKLAHFVLLAPPFPAAAATADDDPASNARLCSFLLAPRRTPCAPIVMLVVALAAGELRHEVDIDGAPRLTVQGGVASVEVMEARASQAGASAAAPTAHCAVACLLHMVCVPRSLRMLLASSLCGLS